MRHLVLAVVLSLAAVPVLAQGVREYRVLATSKTSTMEKEMNAAAEAGYVYSAVMGGETAFGGTEAVVVMQKNPTPSAMAYTLLATSKTATMQKEMQAAADLGFEYVGQTVFSSMFGGDEVVVIMQRDANATARHQYLLVATSKTSTLQKELDEAGGAGYSVVGMTVSKTAMGGAELVAIARRDR